MSKKLRKTTDPYVGVLLVVPKSTRDAWKLAADREGLTLTDWASSRLNGADDGGTR